MIPLDSMSFTGLSTLDVSFCGICLYTDLHTALEIRLIQCFSQSQKPYSSSGVANKLEYCWIHWFTHATWHPGTDAAIALGITFGRFSLGPNSIARCQTFCCFPSRSALAPMRLRRSISIIVPCTPRTTTYCVLLWSIPSEGQFVALLFPSQVAPPTGRISNAPSILLPLQPHLWLILRSPYPQLLSFAQPWLIFQLSAQLLDSKRTKKSRLRDAFIYKTMSNALFCWTQSIPLLRWGWRFNSNFYCAISSVSLRTFLSWFDGSILEFTIATSALRAEGSHIVRLEWGCQFHPFC